MSDLNRSKPPAARTGLLQSATLAAGLAAVLAAALAVPAHAQSLPEGVDPAFA